MKKKKHWLNPEKAEHLRITVYSLLSKGYLLPGQKDGAQSKLAVHYGISRQRVSQVVEEQRRRMAAFG